MDYEIEKRTLGDGWVEVRFQVLRPLDTADFKVSGRDARFRIAELFLSGAAGVCRSFGHDVLELRLNELWGVVREALQ